MKKTALALLLCVIYFMSTLSECHAAPRILYMALGDPEDSEMGVVGKTFKYYVEEKSNGAIRIELHFAGALGDEPDTVQAVRSGDLDLSLIGIANVVPFVQQLGILTLPYLFNNINEVVIATTGAPAELLNSYAEKSGFRIMAWAYTDFRYISNSRRPITKMNDMQGLRFRVPQSPILIETYKAFGGTPVPLPWTATFSALETGSVDGQCYGYVGFRAMKFQSAKQKYITEVHYTYQLQPLIMSESVYRTFTQEEKEILRAAGKAAQEAGLEYENSEVEKAKEELVKAGILISRLEDEAAWKKAAIEQVWPKMADFVGGRRSINVFLQAAGKQPWNP